MSRGGGGALPIVKPSLDPCKEGTCFSEAAIAAGFVEEEALGIVGKPSPSLVCAQVYRPLSRRSAGRPACRLAGLYVCVLVFSERSARPARCACMSLGPTSRSRHAYLPGACLSAWLAFGPQGVGWWLAAAHQDDTLG